MTRFARNQKVTYWEEPVFDAEDTPFLQKTSKGKNLTVVVPHVLPNQSGHRQLQQLRSLLNRYLAENFVPLQETIFYYYTPMALAFSRHLKPLVTIYDCMDELSAFDFAPKELTLLEEELLEKADLVFTGGHALYEAKKHRHHNIHPLPSSVDQQHFAQAKTIRVEPSDQRKIPHPRLGFFGVIDERFDRRLIRELAEKRPQWQFLFIGPIVKIDPDALPRAANIHYLGQKPYDDLPAYLASWDIALIPFAQNRSTQFISPTKTPEYLSAGIPVISTPIKDVVTPYGDRHLVQIAADADGFVTAAEKEFATEDKEIWKQAVGNFLSRNSWDETFSRMQKLIHEVNQVAMKMVS